jgi:AhpD family alkylhydroperoxidase
MTQRLAAATLAPEGYKALFASRAYVVDNVPRPFLDILWLRISQINGCAYCVDAHGRDAASRGASAIKLLHTATWWESPLFDERERAALAWAEAVTRLEHQRVPEEVFATLRQHYSDKEIADLTIAVAAMNAWNRIGVSLRMSPKS